MSVTVKKGYTIYITPFEFIAQKGNFTAHGKTVKKSVQDLEFKILSDKIRKEPIKSDTIINKDYYRAVTGACELGMESWIKRNNINKEELRADELLPLLTKSNAYGIEKFNSLITF